MKKLVLIITAMLILMVGCYWFSPRFKFLIQYGILLPNYCTNYNFQEEPNFSSLLGLDGHGAQAEFEIQQENIIDLIETIEPEKIWLKFSLNNSNLKDKTINYSEKEIPTELIDGKLEVMLWSEETKGDYYNIVIHKSENGKSTVSIAMPFT